MAAASAAVGSAMNTASDVARTEVAILDCTRSLPAAMADTQETAFSRCGHLSLFAVQQSGSRVPDQGAHCRA